MPEPLHCAAIGCDAVALSDVKAGIEARVVCLETAQNHVAAKLASMGILPGVKLRLIRRSPAFVFRIDYAEFAMDRELASVIRVQPE